MVFFYSLIIFICSIHLPVISFICFHFSFISFSYLRILLMIFLLFFTFLCSVITHFLSHFFLFFFLCQLYSYLFTLISLLSFLLFLLFLLFLFSLFVSTLLSPSNSLPLISYLLITFLIYFSQLSIFLLQHFPLIFSFFPLLYYYFTFSFPSLFPFSFQHQRAKQSIFHSEHFPFRVLQHFS